MQYSLPTHISYGFVGSRAVVLDLAADRYFLVGEAETSLLDPSRSPTSLQATAGSRTLFARGLLTPGPGRDVAPVVQPMPQSSALEQPEPGGGVGAWETARSCTAALLWLRFAGLPRTIDRWRKHQVKAAQRCGSRCYPQKAGFFARGFADARTLVPTSRLCVPDSLALALCLWRRGIAADIYFGVQLDPFLAHAWVQQDGVVLSDPLNIVADYRAVFKL